MATPLDDIKDGHEFQRIVAEYFRCLKQEKHEYQIADIEVYDNGVGADDGCDVLVEFHFKDVIGSHTHKWVIECKCWDKNVGVDDVNTNRILGVLKAHNARGYLLICKKDASAPLKRTFKGMTKNSEEDFEIWNGTRLWHVFSQRESLLKAFFTGYYQRKFIQTNDKENYENYFNHFKEQLKK